MSENTSDPQRWKALAFIAIAQLMVVLDATIVNIALPRPRPTSASPTPTGWVVTAYTPRVRRPAPAGGRLGDLLGRKRVFLVGLIGFALASALGGAATGTGMLLGARALQGVFGALLAPAALSLRRHHVHPGQGRATAFGVFSSIAMAGSAIGLLLGGALTEYLDWRWCLYVNIVFAARRPRRRPRLHPRAGDRARQRLDLPGTVLGTGSVLALVWGFAHAEEAGGARHDPGHVRRLRGALAAFVAIESRTRLRCCRCAWSPNATVPASTSASGSP